MTASPQQHVRYMKILLVSLMAIFAFLVALNNITDYNSNFMFVQHVLSMDTTFEGNALMWRSLEANWVHHLGYWLIIITESAVSILCFAGAYGMYVQRNAVARYFNAAKILACWGLTLGIALWFGGFMAVGGEWFVMWQSQIWNGQEAAFRFYSALFGTLIVLLLPEPALD